MLFKFFGGVLAVLQASDQITAIPLSGQRKGSNLSQLSTSEKSETELCQVGQYCLPTCWGQTYEDPKNCTDDAYHWHCTGCDNEYHCTPFRLSLPEPHKIWPPPPTQLECVPTTPPPPPPQPPAPVSTNST